MAGVAKGRPGRLLQRCVQEHKTPESTRCALQPPAATGRCTSLRRPHIPSSCHVEFEAAAIARRRSSRELLSASHALCRAESSNCAWANFGRPLACSRVRETAFPLQYFLRSVLWGYAHAGVTVCITRMNPFDRFDAVEIHHIAECYQSRSNDHRRPKKEQAEIMLSLMQEFYHKMCNIE
eukprot:3282852-Pleurochrysis_carterae.AAC.1